MTKKEIRGCIDYRLDAIGKKLGLELIVDYLPQYGGYSLYVATEGGGHSSAGCCFVMPSKRMSGPEMLAYLDGILNFMIDVQYGHVGTDWLKKK